MAETSAQTLTLDEKHHFLLRRLHSLSGIIPIGVFLIEHLLTNSMALIGKERFNEDVHWIHHLPYLIFLEVFGIFLPLAFHAIYGVKIAIEAKHNVSAYRYAANWRYSAQRISGYIAFIFLVIHLFKFRFAHLIGWGQEFMDPTIPDKFALTQKGLMHWSIWGYEVHPAITLTLYVIGLAAACFHLGNGIWGFCITWGIAVGAKAQKRMGLVGALVGIVLFAWGCLSLYAFARAEHEPPGTDVVAHSIVGPQSLTTEN